MSENSKDYLVVVLAMTLAICTIVVTIALCEKYLGLGL